MKIYKVITDHKPEYCLSCPLSTLHICGKQEKEYATSGAMHYVTKPDDRCLIKVEQYGS